MDYELWTVNCFSPEEEAGDACKVHCPRYCKAARNAKDKRDKQEKEAGGVELQIGDEPLAEDGEDGGEDVDRKAVAAKEGEPPSPFRGSNSAEPKQS